MDLASFKPSDEGKVLNLEGPDGQPLMKDGKPISITLASVDSMRWRKQRRVNVNRTLDADRRNGGKPTSTAESMETNTLECLAAVTVAWENIELDGEKLECTHDNAVKLYRSVPLVFDQVEAFVTNRANFQKGVSAK